MAPKPLTDIKGNTIWVRSCKIIKMLSPFKNLSSVRVLISESREVQIGMFSDNKTQQLTFPRANPATKVARKVGSYVILYSNFGIYRLAGRLLRGKVIESLLFYCVNIAFACEILYL